MLFPDPKQAAQAFAATSAAAGTGEAAAAEVAAAGIREGAEHEKKEGGEGESRGDEDDRRHRVKRREGAGRNDSCLPAVDTIVAACRPRGVAGDGARGKLR